MRENGTSNPNHRLISTNIKTSLPLPVSGLARELERDGAGNPGSGNTDVDGDCGRGSMASDIIKPEGCFGEPEGSHV